MEIVVASIFIKSVDDKVVTIGRAFHRRLSLKKETIRVILVVIYS